MRKWLIICLLSMGVLPLRSVAQDDYNTKANKYISKYAALAVAEQRRSGVPASIILAQGILETEAGCSELCSVANNHFGIKCRKEWTGETFAHDDDRPRECFRKYKCSEDSYKDHSDYLVNSPRYASLFKLSPTDYASWAIGLKRCGYATNPKYATQLIKIIEDFRLQEYTYAALDNKDLPEDYAAQKAGKQAEAVDANQVANANSASNSPGKFAAPPPASVTTAPAVTHVPLPSQEPAARQNTSTSDRPYKPVETARGNGVLSVNGLRAIRGNKGDMLLQYALKYNIRYERLLEYNDLPDGPLPANMYVYLEKKNYKGKNETHIVRPGENLLLISQLEGIQLKRLMVLNRITIYGEEPIPGEILRLQTICEIKPKVAVVNKPKQPIMLASVDSSRYVSTRGTALATAPKFTYVDKPNKPNSKIIVMSERSPDVAHQIVSATSQAAFTEPLLPRRVEKADTVLRPLVTQTPIITSSIESYVIDTNTRIVHGRENAIVEMAHKDTIAQPDRSEQIQTQAVVKVTTNDTLQEVPEDQTLKIADNVATNSKKELTTSPVIPAQAVVGSVAKVDTVIVANSSSVAIAKEQPNKIDTLVVAEPVATPAPDTVKQEPLDEVDALKAKFDKVIYADKKKAQTNTTAKVVTPKVEVAAPVQHEDDNSYIVKEGDTAYSIAKDHNITMRQLMDWNNIDFDTIKTGQKLVVKK